jgi:hypothetical protein
MNKKIEKPFNYDDVDFNLSMKKFQKVINLYEEQNKCDFISFNEAFIALKQLVKRNQYFQLMFSNNLVGSNIPNRNQMNNLFLGNKTIYFKTNACHAISTKFQRKY